MEDKDCGCHGEDIDRDDCRFPAVVAELERTKRNSYAHMCRDEHVQIGHNVSTGEMCPMCCAIDNYDRLRQACEAALAELGEPRYYNAKSRAVKLLQSALQETQ